MSESEIGRIKRIRDHIDENATPSYCLAKWHHVTLYLQDGTTHSCYHPRPHKIPLSELKVGNG